jgi:hypothetical protein
LTPRSTANDAANPWAIYIAAREEARRRGETRVGTDHLILALLHDAEAVSVLGVTLDEAHDAMEARDRRALGAVGIAATLDAPLLPARDLPRRPTVKAVLKDRLPLTPAAKRALEIAAKATGRGHRISLRHLLLELITRESPDPAASLVADLGIDVGAVRQQLVTPTAPA